MTAHTIPVNGSRTSRFLGARAALVVICILYVAAFVLVYNNLIVPVWGYEGFRSAAPPERAALGCLLATLPSLWMPIHMTRPSLLVYWLLYLLVVVPACVVPIHSLRDHSTGPLVLGACIVAMFGLTAMIYRLPLRPMPRVRLENYEFLAIVAVLSIICYTLMILSFGLHFRYIPLKDVYLVRAQYKETLSHGFSLVAYAINWQMYVINPLLIASGLITRRTWAAFAGVVGQFAIYSITGFRDVLFSAVFLLYLVWAMRWGKSFGTRFASSWTAIFTLAALLELFGYSRTLEGLVGERMTAGPGLLTGYYYEFFSSHPKALLGQSIFFKSWVDYPYALGPPELIGYQYFHDSGMSANANLWADAYANFGYCGIVGFTLLLAVVLWSYDSIAVGRDRRVAALVMALPGFALANVGLQTCLITHGIGLAMLLVYLLPAVKPNFYRVPLPASPRGVKSWGVSEAGHKLFRSQTG